MRSRLFLFLSILLISGAVYGKSAPWNGTTKAPSLSGSTYTVTTAEELAWIASESQTKDFSGLVVRLGDDLDLGGTQETPPSWIPIGSEAKPFKGELDGNNHVIYNLYVLSSLFPKGIGLFAETASEAVIHHLGLAQGQIMTDATNNVGAFVGINRGTLHHCFNMTQIIAHNGNNIGGLVGTNEGTIEYAYNAGIITDANSQVGGLVGYNKSSATLTECYNMGYCKGSDHVGALFGKNEAPEAQLKTIVFDQQLTRMYATGDAANDDILKDNTKYAVVKSATFFSKSSPFYDKPEWEYHSGGYWSHARLKCFGDQEASQVSVKGILLDDENLPMERAEGVGAPIEGNKMRKTFKLETMDDQGLGKGEWHSPSPDVILISNPTGNIAEVYRPCGNQEVILTLMYGTAVKQVYTIVKGYDVFDAGILEGNAAACWNEENVKLFSKNGDGKEPTGGKDDEQKDEELSYQFMIIRDTVLSRNPDTYAPMDTFYLNYSQYKEWPMPTDMPGQYAFRQYVHDYKCKTEWTVSKGKETSVGRMFFAVRDKFDPGELVEKPDTLYAVPVDWTIESFRDASGGGGDFQYIWRMERSVWNPETGEWDPVPDDTREPLYKGAEIVKTASFDYTFTQPGKYTFTRKVSEQSCETTPMESLRPHIVVVYEPLNGGEIESFTRELCSPFCADTIHELEAPHGGDERFIYRWTCNGDPVSGADTAVLALENVPMESDRTYIFRREVKDGAEGSEWVTSAGQVQIKILKGFDAGSVVSFYDQQCTQPAAVDAVTVTIDEKSAPSGDGNLSFNYCWLLFKGGADTTLLDTFPINKASLDTVISLSHYGLAVPVTFFVKRAVQNTLCVSEWKKSNNAAVWKFGRSEKKSIPIKVCAKDLPYTYSYTFADNHTEEFTFSANNQTIELEDLTVEGCPMNVTLQSQVTAVPKVEVKPILSVCETAGMLAIECEILSGAPDRFDLTFPDSAHKAGLKDSINGILPAEGVIEIPLPADMPLGPQSLTIVFYADQASSADCKTSNPQTLTFSVDMDGFVHRKDNDVLFVDNSGKHDEKGLTFVSYQWYKNGEPIKGATNQYYYEYNGLNGYYQVIMTGTDGVEYRSCVYDMRPMEGIEELNAAEGGIRKIIRNGQLLLIVGDRVYNVTGQEVVR